MGRAAFGAFSSCGADDDAALFDFGRASTAALRRSARTRRSADGHLARPNIGAPPRFSGLRHSYHDVALTGGADASGVLAAVGLARHLGVNEKERGNRRTARLAALASRRRLARFHARWPQGPRRKAHGGVVYLASKSGVPILPVALAASDFWQMRSWDRYLIPKPFARVHIHMGPLLEIPDDIPRGENGAWCERVKAALDDAERAAQDALTRQLAGASNSVMAKSGQLS